ncbi:MAG TPA: hypothetical protein VJ461_06310 [Candidatus Nanoarchaeia archaeon]|nr:hypothetical protein [Candidatus Nanoarchaeia archaeon]
MNKQKWPESLNKRLENLGKKTEAQITNMKLLERKGASKFRQLEARCSNPKTGKLEEDLVITAIQSLENENDIRSFYLGYAKDIRANPKKYPDVAAKDPVGYARYDIGLALNLHFRSNKTHERWNNAIPNLYS